VFDFFKNYIIKNILRERLHPEMLPYLDYEEGPDLVISLGIEGLLN
jgi:hypothetical protein